MHTQPDQCASSQASTSRQHYSQLFTYPQILPHPLPTFPWLTPSWTYLDPNDVDQFSRSAPPSAVAEPSSSEMEDMIGFSGEFHERSQIPQLSLFTESGHATRRSSPVPPSPSSSRNMYSNDFSPFSSCPGVPTHFFAFSPPEQYPGRYLGDGFPPGHYLQFDRPPNPKQRTLAEDSITSRQMQLTTLDMQVAAARMAVLAAQDRHRNLMSQRENLRAQIARDKNRLQPALYLPVETLAEIFAYCVADDCHSIWKLSAVCFDWRVAALTFPRLWCRVVVPSNLTPADQVRMTRLWIERSRNVEALEIKYQVIDDSARYSTATFEEIMTLLAAHLHRWRYFDLETNLDDCIHICLRLTSGPAPNLETFKVRESDRPATRRNRRVLPCRVLRLGQTPKLRHAQLYTSAWPTATFLHGLTVLTLVSGRTKRMVDLWSVLDECEGLERLTLKLPVDSEFDPPGRARSGPLKLERLHTLSGNAMVLALLPHLLVPSLGALHVNDVDAFLLMRTLNVLDLRSNPPLHTLRLRNCRLVSGTTGLSLKSIKRLEFHDSEVDDGFFLSLSMPTAGTSSWIRPYRTWALPSLEVIVIRRSQYVREDALRRLVEARNPTTPNAMCSGGTPAVGLPARIKVVDVRECRRVRPAFSDWIQERLERVSDRFVMPSDQMHRHGATNDGSMLLHVASLGLGLLVPPPPPPNDEDDIAINDIGEELDVEIELDGP